MADAGKEEGEFVRASYDFKAMEFSLKDYIEEIAVLIEERQQFLDSKLERRTIGKEQENLSRYRLARMHGLHIYLLRIAEFQANKRVDENPEPDRESLPPKPETVEPQQAPVDDWND